MHAAMRAAVSGRGTVNARGTAVLAGLRRALSISTCALTALVAVSCSAGRADENTATDDSAATAAFCAKGNPRLFAPHALAEWRGLRTDLGPRNLQVAEWMAWLAGASYIDDFGNIEDPGFVFRCGFHRLGYGHDEAGTYSVSAAGKSISVQYTNEGELWWNAGLELKRFLAACPSRTEASDECKFLDALEKNLFTQLPPSRDIGKLHGQTLEGMGHFKQGTTQAFVLHNRDTRHAVVVFRGTQREVKEDLLADLDARPRDLGAGIHVHAGFHHALYEVTDGERQKNAAELLLERLDHLPRGTDLYVTGHSLGGALATLFASEVLARRDRPYALRGLYTFGAPAVGNAAFGNSLNAKLRGEGAWHGRFTHGKDLIPALTWYTTPYVHNTELDDGSPRHAQGINLHCSGSGGKGYDVTEWSRRRWYCSGPIADHDRLRYFEVLRTIANRAVSDADLGIPGDR
jgi:hypothetical protein